MNFGAFQADPLPPPGILALQPCLLNELTNSSQTPREEVRRELLGALVDDGALDVFLLGRTERPPCAWGGPAQCRSDGRTTTSLKQVDAGPCCRAAQA
jgi:hypothetical protein